jgi:hypothetical protein
VRSGDLLFRPGSLPRLSVLWLISGEGPWAREGRSPAQVGRAEPMGLRVEREGSRGPSGPGSGPWSIGSFRSMVRALRVVSVCPKEPGRAAARPAVWCECECAVQSRAG